MAVKRSNSSLKTFQPVKVICVTAACSAEKIGEVSQQLFQDLESKLPKHKGRPDLRGRKMYGTYHKGIYRACTTLSSQSEEDNFDTWEIPGGRYASAKIDDWTNHTEAIGPTFERLARTYERDMSRPVIEFYRSHTQLVLLFPVS